MKCDLDCGWKKKGRFKECPFSFKCNRISTTNDAVLYKINMDVISKTTNEIVSVDFVIGVTPDKNIIDGVCRWLNTNRSRYSYCARFIKLL